MILLAGLIASKAHDTQPAVYTKGWSTTQSAASRSTENPSNPSDANNESVVVNWLLVCEDLCGWVQIHAKLFTGSQASEWQEKIRLVTWFFFFFFYFEKVYKNDEKIIVWEIEIISFAQKKIFSS